MKNEKRCTGTEIPVQQADALFLSCAKNAPDTHAQYISHEQIAQAKIARYLGYGEENALRAAIDATGYTAGEIHAAPYEKKGLFSFLKK